MKLITINKKDYNIKNLWVDVVIFDWLKVSKIGLTEDDIEQLKGLDFNITNDKKYKLINIFSDVPVDIIKMLDDDSIYSLIFTIREFVVGLYDWKEINKKKLDFKTKIKWGGRTYYVPESLHINDKIIPAIDEPSKNVVEVSNLIQLFEQNKENGIEILPHICAIYLREKGDKKEYDEKDISKRAEMFKDLPVMYAVELFFFKVLSLSNYLIHSQISSQGEGNQKIRTLVYSLNGYMLLLLRRIWVQLKKLKKRVFGKFWSY